MKSSGTTIFSNNSIPSNEIKRVLRLFLTKSFLKIKSSDAVILFDEGRSSNTIKWCYDFVNESFPLNGIKRCYNPF